MKKSYQVKKKPVKEWLWSLGITIVLLGAVVGLCFTVYTVQDYGLAPNVSKGKTVLVSRLGSVRRFDLIVFRDPHDSSKKKISRVIGLPGETLEYRDGRLLVEDQEIPERFLFEHQQEHPPMEDGTLDMWIHQNRLPEDGYFVLGDNREYATDSRYFGVVHRKEIIGIVQLHPFRK